MTKLLSFSTLVFVGLASLALAQEPPKPGPEHQWMKKMEGEWDCVVKMMGNTSKGSQTSKYDMNYFLTTEFNGEFGGVPFKGKSTMGYCAARKKYISLWTDSMSPSPMTVEGTYDKETHTLTEIGQSAGMDGKLAKYKLVNKYKDEDHYTMKMFQIGEDNKETEMMEIEYTRKKK